MEAKQPKPKQLKILSKMTLTNINPNITKSTQDEILTSIKDLLRDRTDIKNIKISHFDNKYIVIDFIKYLDNENEFLSIIKNINEILCFTSASAKGSYMSYTYKDNEGMTEPRKYLYKYSYKSPINNIMFIDDD
jgi:hypothetical protein